MVRLLCLLALALVLIGWSAPARAGVSAMSVYPSRHAVVVAPGARQTVSVTVANTGDEPLRIRAYSSDWSLEPSGEMVFLPAGQGTHSAHAMMAVTPTQIVVPPGKTQLVRLQLAVPANQRGGEYHGMIFFETGPARATPQKPGAMVLFNQRIGVTVYVAVTPFRREATVRSLAYVPAAKGAPARLGLVLQNLGTVHVRATGRIKLVKDGRPVLDRAVEDLAVLRESKRLFYVPLDAPLPAGRYRATLTLDYGGNETIEAETDLAI